MSYLTIYNFFWRFIKLACDLSGVVPLQYLKYRYDNVVNNCTNLNREK